MPEDSWYSVQSLYSHGRSPENAAADTYEERIVLFRASSLEHALQLGEVEAKKYAQTHSGCRFLAYLVAFELNENDLSAGTEVFSLLRDSDLPAREYVARFYDAGTERMPQREP